MANSQNQVPAQLEPIASFGNEVPVVVKPVWYKFFASLSAVAQSIVGGVLGFTVDAAVKAAGNTQGTATVLETEWVVVIVTPLGAGVVLSSFGPGVPNQVTNLGANPLNVYPPLGSQIDGLGVNAPYLLAATKTQTFNQTKNTQYQSVQLG